MKFYDPSGVYKGNKDNVLDVENSNSDLTDSTYWYLGFISPRTGGWLIQRIHIIGDAMISEYATGKTRDKYDAHWNSTTGRYVVGSPALTFTSIDQAEPI